MTQTLPGIGVKPQNLASKKRPKEGLFLSGNVASGYPLAVLAKIIFLFLLGFFMPVLLGR